MTGRDVPDDDDTLLREGASSSPVEPDDDVTILRPADALEGTGDRGQGTAGAPMPPHSLSSSDDDVTVLRPADAPVASPAPSPAVPASTSDASEDVPARTSPEAAREEADADTTVVLPEAGDTESAVQAGAPAAPATGASGAGFAGKLKRLGSESLIYGLSSVFGRFLSYALQFLYVRYFNPAENGVQSAVYTYVPILSIVFLWGMDVAYMRSAASVKDRPLEERQRAFTMSYAVVAVLGAIALALGWIVAPWLKGPMALPLDGLLYLLAIIYTDALLAVPYAHLRMTGRPGRYAKLRLLFVFVSIILNVVLIVWLRWGINAIFLSNLVANLVILALFTPEVAKLFRPRLLKGVEWKPLWAYALPIMPAMFAVMLVENGDRLVLNWLPDNVAQQVYGTTTKGVVGIYNFNYKLGVAMLLIAQMFRMAWTPFSLQHGRDPDAPRLFSRVMTVVMLVCATAFLGFSLLIPSLAAVPAIQRWPESPAYWAGLAIMPVILLGYVFSAMYAVVTAGLYIEKKTQVLPWIAGAGAVVNIAICIVAVRHSMVAVAWATPASYALMAALGAWQSNKVYPIPFEWTRLAHLGAIVGAVYAVDWWLRHEGWAPGEWRSVGAKFALIFIAFPALLWLTRFLRAGELDVVKRLARRR